jgi:hypothetical protein
MAVRFVEYVNARWQPWAARSRAQAAPMLDFIMISLVICKLTKGVWEKGLSYPPEAPVIKARRPDILLSTIFFEI